MIDPLQDPKQSSGMSTPSYNEQEVQEWMLSQLDLVRTDLVRSRIVFSPTLLVNVGTEFQHQDVSEVDFASRFGVDNAVLALLDLVDCPWRVCFQMWKAYPMGADGGTKSLQ